MFTNKNNDNEIEYFSFFSNCNHDLCDNKVMIYKAPSWLVNYPFIGICSIHDANIVLSNHLNSSATHIYGVDANLVGERIKLSDYYNIIRDKTEAR